MIEVRRSPVPQIPDRQRRIPIVHHDFGQMFLDELDVVPDRAGPAVPSAIAPSSTAEGRFMGECTRVSQNDWRCLRRRTPYIAKPIASTVVIQQ